jgi:hypothetical protein
MEKGAKAEFSILGRRWKALNDQILGIYLVVRLCFRCKRLKWEREFYTYVNCKASKKDIMNTIKE